MNTREKIEEILKPTTLDTWENTVHVDILADQLENLINEQKKELIQEIKKMAKEVEYFTTETVYRYDAGDFLPGIAGYNQAIKDILNKLNQ